MERIQRSRGIPNLEQGKLTPRKLNSYMSALVSRAQLASRLGKMTYDGNRDLYQTLGYPKVLTFEEHYVLQYSRQDIAKAVIDRPVRAAWRGGVSIHAKNSKGKISAIQKKWDELENTFKLHTILMRADRLTGLGRYGVLLLGLNDISTVEDLSKPVLSKSNKLLFIKPLSEGSAKIISFDTNAKSERFGKPEMYQVAITVEGDTTKNVDVHHSRILHITDDLLEDDVYGTPRLQPIFNRLLDIEKIVGGDAEMFWRGARPGYQGLIDKDFTLTTKSEEDLQDQFDEFENNMRRFLLMEGVTVKEFQQQITDPSKNIDVQIQMICAQTGTPKRILLGSERGELSSSQDREEWNLWVQTRREEFMEPMIVRPLVTKFIDLGILPKPENGDGFVIIWDELFAMSPKEKAEIAEKIANAIRYYTATPTAEYILPKELFLRKLLGLTQEEMDEVKAIVDALPDLEPQLTQDEMAALNVPGVGSPINGKNPMAGTGNDSVAKKQKATV